MSMDAIHVKRIREVVMSAARFHTRDGVMAERITNDAVFALEHDAAIALEEGGWIDRDVAVERLQERVEALHSALHSISLGAQSSQTSKEELGREARRAIERSLEMAGAEPSAEERVAALERRVGEIAAELRRIRKRLVELDSLARRL